MKKVSPAVSVSVSGEVAASRKGKVKGAQVARAPKAPTDEQYVKMAGAMESALERLRTFYQTMEALKPVVVGGVEFEVIELHPAERAALLNEVVEAANILRVGLKARIRR